MNSIFKKQGKRTAFTIVELLTIMSIIVILISLLVPAMNRVKRYAKRVKQKAQFHSISVALDLFNAEEEGYPPSDENSDRVPPEAGYCGAMKLCEAMVGQDILGFHQAANFLYNEQDSSGNLLYRPETRNGRRGLYLQLENANVNKVKHVYGAGASTDYTGEELVLCDVYSNVRLQDPDNEGISGKSGMPVLYFRSNIANISHDFTEPKLSTYNYEDNDKLVQLGMPWNTFDHPMASTGATRYEDGGGGFLPSHAGIFYNHTRNNKITTTGQPLRADSYILLSAGFDGEYGTHDDVYNFEKVLGDFVELSIMNGL